MIVDKWNYLRKYKKDWLTLKKTKGVQNYLFAIILGERFDNNLPDQFNSAIQKRKNSFWLNFSEKWHTSNDFQE